ncbi:hypothetical protein KY362_00930 [Candidatus Woesearchaeota archaeon]|nr:hypothetical protein [Candidatus Woesearchaeota archaeon]
MKSRRPLIAILLILLAGALVLLGYKLNAYLGDGPDGTIQHSQQEKKQSTVLSDASETLEIPAQPGEISTRFTLTDTQGNPVDGVRFSYSYVEGPSTKPSGFETSPFEGTAYSANLEFGKYVARASAEGYHITKKEFIIGPRNDKVAIIMIPREPGTCKDTGDRESAEKMLEFFDIQPDIECAEVWPGRGGEVMAKGNYQGQPIELSVQWDFCTSSGATCGWEATAKTAGPEFQSIKQTLCSKLKWSEYDYNTPKENFERSPELQSRCLAGEFDTAPDTISIRQYSGRSSSHAEQGKAEVFD